MERKQNNNVKEISIPLLAPIFIVLISIIIFIKIYTPNSTVIAATEQEETIENNNQNEIEEIVEKEEIVNIEETVEETPQEEIIENITTEAPRENISQNTTSRNDTYKINGKQYNIIGFVTIPSLGIEYPILPETTTQLLKVSITKYWGGNPNEAGNLVLIGHNYKNSRFFGKLPNIKNGEIIKIRDINGRTLDYKVYDTYIVDPDDNSCTTQLTNGKTEITLITCYYENGAAHATKRFVVKARADV